MPFEKVNIKQIVNEKIQNNTVFVKAYYAEVLMDFISEHFNMIISIATALVICFQAARFSIKRQEIGIPYLKFGPPINSVIPFAILFGLHLVILIFSRAADAETRVYQIIIYVIALICSLYLSFQRRIIAENGIISSPFHLFTWEEVQYFIWKDYHVEKKGNKRLLLAVEKRLLFFSWTGINAVEVPEENKKKVLTLLRLYIPYKEKTDD